MADSNIVTRIVARRIAKVTGYSNASRELAQELSDAGLLTKDEPPGEFETEAEANAAGVHSGTLFNGDTFGSED